MHVTFDDEFAAESRTGADDHGRDHIHGDVGHHQRAEHHDQGDRQERNERVETRCILLFCLIRRQYLLRGYAVPRFAVEITGREVDEYGDDDDDAKGDRNLVFHKIDGSWNACRLGGKVGGPDRRAEVHEAA